MTISGPVPRREFLFDMEFALSKAARLWPRKRVYGEDNPYRLVAQRVIEQLELCGIRVFPQETVPSGTAYRPARGPRARTRPHPRNESADVIRP